MATLVLGAVGASLGGSIGSSVLGLSGAVVGRAVGVTVGRVIDQAILGQGAEVVEQGRLERLSFTGASEGRPIPRAYGRVRLPGQVIWATRFRENQATTNGSGKGTQKTPAQTPYSYSVSLAVALCEGQIRRVSRIWADGVEVAWGSIQIRVHDGAEDQLPDALIEAVEGQASAPAYRGTAYVVIEDLDLTPFGNRVPQLTFEIVRYASSFGALPSAAELIRGVALVPGTGEYALATSEVHYNYGGGQRNSANVNTLQGISDFKVSLRDLVEELPNLRSASLIVSWFGDDLRCGQCRIRPKVEQNEHDASAQAWQVSGLTRKDAVRVPLLDGRPVYGGTPGDDAVVEAIRDLNNRGIDVTFYPFILMDQLSGNGLPDPWGSEEQPTLPWRGRITTDLAPSRTGTTDGTVTAETEVNRFFGSARHTDFLSRSGKIVVSGLDDEWSYRRFILHYAHLCAMAGGVEAFCIGSEMRGLTTIRGGDNRFPAVEALLDLARDVREILPDAKIGYAADWSEYYGYRPEDSDDLLFHLDTMWGDPAIDFVGIDNYMPMADWRDGTSHLDARYPSGYDIPYLKSNIEGGEGYDWYYRDEEDRVQQRRLPITDGSHWEPWIFRYKDVRSWWSNAHHNRIQGIRATEPTAWIPNSKPIRFIEYGCAAIDKGANQPNKFIDPKSSESSLPWSSTGHRDDAIQQQYLRALLSYWDDLSQNPRLPSGERMIDLDHSFAWAWDTRPWPYFPQMTDFWTDGTNYARGHWLSGRSTNQPLEIVIRELCETAGLQSVDVSGVHGIVRGYSISAVQTARADLQPLLMAYGVEATEINGTMAFRMRADARVIVVDPVEMVRGGDGVVERARAPAAESAGTLVIHHLDHDNDFAPAVSGASMHDVYRLPVTETEVPLSLTRQEARGLAMRYLAEAQVVRDTIEFSIPPSRADLAAGDVFQLAGEDELWRVDKLDDAWTRRIRAVRTEQSLYEPSGEAEVDAEAVRSRPIAPLPVDVNFLNLPLLRSDDNPFAPYLAFSGTPWPGSVAVYASVDDSGYQLDKVVETSSVVGEVMNALQPAIAGVWDKGSPLLVRLGQEGAASISNAALFAGGNAAAIGMAPDGPWEIFQFRDAQLVGDGVWALSMRLRGQRGTEWASGSVWPAGSRIVLLDGKVGQIDVGREVLGLPRHYRIGPGRLPMTDTSYTHVIHAPTGEALRPFAPVHLRIGASDGGRVITWVRRSRFEQAAWDVADVSLGEAREAYLVRLSNAQGRTVWEKEVTSPSAGLSAGEITQLELGGPLATVSVAQLSDEVGPGHWAATQYC